MSKYLSELGIAQSVPAITAYIKSRTNIDFEISKEAKGLKVVWCHNNILHRHFIDAPILYVIQEAHINELLEKIKSTTS